MNNVIQPYTESDVDYLRYTHELREEEVSKLEIPVYLAEFRDENEPSFIMRITNAIKKNFLSN